VKKETKQPTKQTPKPKPKEMKLGDKFERKVILKK
jgi:hypothetical protein